MSKPFRTPQWGLWIQPDGPNTTMRFLGCHTLDDISEPGGGINELIRCFKPDGTGWDILGATINPPDPVTTTVTGLIDKTADYLERVAEGANCPFPLYVNGKLCPPYDVFAGASRWYAIEQSIIGTKGLMSLVHRDEDSISEQSFEITAYPPVLRGRDVSSDRLGMATFTDNANDIATCSIPDCASTDCGEATDYCEVLVIATDTDGTNEPQILRSADNGATWAATAADPFNAKESAKAVECFSVGANTSRILVARDTVAATPMHVEYSDDAGANWTDVTVTGSTNAYAAVYGGALYAIDMYHIWLVITDGAAGSEIWFSEDGGVTWTAQTLADPTKFLYAIYFKDEDVGMVVGAADYIEVTTDGGDTWAAATATGDGGDLLSVSENQGGDIWWVTSDDGQIYYSTDHGTTWAERTFTGSGAGAVYDAGWSSRTVGWMVHSPTAATGIVYRSRNGGLTWEVESDTVDGELYAIEPCTINQAWSVGEVGASPATVLVLKTHD